MASKLVLAAEEERKAFLIDRYQARRKELLSILLNQTVLLEGKKGKGKSLAITAIAWQLKDIFNKPVVIIGSKLGLERSVFGDFIEIDERAFIDELGKISEITRSTPEDTTKLAINETLQTMGVNILNATIVFDEAYKLFDSRNPQDKLVKLFGYFVAQSRHYNLTTLMSTPRRDMIDRRVRVQIDWFGRVTVPCRSVQHLPGVCTRRGCSHIANVRFTRGIERWRLKLFGPNYWPMYNSWAVLGFRQKSMDIATI